MLLASGIITLLILLTALFVAAEFAVVGARRSRLRRLAEDGSSLAARVLPVLEDAHALDRYIAASQVGITLSSLILGAYAQASIAPRFAPLIERVAGLDPQAAASTSAVAALRNEKFDFFGRVHVAMAGVLHAHQREDEVAAAVEEIDRPRERTLRPLHRHDRPDRRRGWIL